MPAKYHYNYRVFNVSLAGGWDYTIYPTHALAVAACRHNRVSRGGAHWIVKKFRVYE